MINQSRLTQVNNVANARSAQDEGKARDRLGGLTDGGEGLAGSSALFADSNSAILGNANLAGANSFSQLLEMSKLDKPELQTQKKPEQDDTKKAADSERGQDGTQKKTKNDSSSARKSVKGKEKKEAPQADTEQALSQLLTAQKTVGSNLLSDKTAAVQNNAAADVNRPTVQTDTTNKTEQVPTNVLGQLRTNSAVVEQGPKSLADVMKNLDSKIENLSTMQKNGNPDPAQLGTDQLSELSSKFDDVKVEFNLAENSAGNGAKVMSGSAADELQTRAMMKQLAEQEWSQNDLALRDLVSRQAQQEMALERIGLDRLEQMSQLKLDHFDQLQAQDLQSAAALKQLQMREAAANNQPQWLSYKDLSPDQKAMVDALSGEQSMQNFNQNSSAQTSGLSANSPLSNRLENATTTNNQAGQSANAAPHDAVAGLHSLAKLTGENNAQQQSQNNNSQSSARGDNGSVGGVTAGSSRNEGVKGRFDETVAEQKNEARARESERTREMARSAALRAQSIASELAAKGGGMAKVQIKDSQLGVVELRINMTDNNRVSVELIANSDRIKNELEKQSEELKNGLEKHKVVLDGVNFATDTRLGDSSSQNSSQSDNSRNNQQQQQQQNLSSFSQGQGGFQQQNSSGGERFFEAPRTPLNNPAPVAGNVRKNYSGKNDSQTNVQRAANGSLKVSA